MSTKLYLPSYPSMGEGGIQPAFKQSGGGGGEDDSGQGTLITPIYHNWEGETGGELPSHTEGTLTDGNNPMVVGLNNAPGYSENATGTTSDVSEVAVMDMGGTLGSADSGWRVVLLMRTLSTSSAYVSLTLQDSPDTWQGGGGNSVVWHLQENAVPDYRIHKRYIGGVEDFNENYQAHNQNKTTGNAWRIYRFEQLAAGLTTWECYDTNGTLNYTGTRAYQGTAGTMPVDVQYLCFVGVNGGSCEFPQVWVGRSEDAWPSMPMSPISNL